MHSTRFRRILALALIGVGSAVIALSATIHDVLFSPRLYPILRHPITSSRSDWGLPPLTPEIYDVWLEFPKSSPSPRFLPVAVFDLESGQTVSFIETGDATYGTSDGFAGLRLVRFPAAAGRRYAIRPEVGEAWDVAQASRGNIVVDVPRKVSKRDDFRVAFGELKIVAVGFVAAMTGATIGLSQLLGILRRRSRSGGRVADQDPA